MEKGGRKSRRMVKVEKEKSKRKIENDDGNDKLSSEINFII